MALPDRDGPAMTAARLRALSTMPTAPAAPAAALKAPSAPTAAHTYTYVCTAAREISESDSMCPLHITPVRCMRGYLRPPPSPP